MSKCHFWTPEEAEFLDRFLSRDDALDHCMDLSMLDGYLTAVVSGPNLIMPSEMLRWVWDSENGQEGARFKDQAEAEKVMGMIMQQWNAIALALTQSPEQFKPLIYEKTLEDGSRMPIFEAWCAGYYKGMAIDMRGWAPLLLSQPALLSPVLLYGTADGEEALERLNADESAHRAAAEGLADMVRLVHVHWLAQRRQQEVSGQIPMPIRYGNTSTSTSTSPSPSTSTQPVRRDVPKLGRNDPCHCGSGRKYKHCHGTN